MGCLDWFLVLPFIIQMDSGLAGFYFLYFRYAEIIISYFKCIEHMQWNILELCAEYFSSAFCWGCVKDAFCYLGYLPYFLRNMSGCIVKLAHSSSGDREDICITHLIIIIKSEVSTFPIVVIFSVAVCLRWLYYHMLSVLYISWERRVWCPLLCILVMGANNGIH